MTDAADPKVNPAADPAAAPGAKATDTSATDPAGGDPKKLAADPTLGSGGAKDPAIISPADFPDDWREKMAGDDAKRLTQLKRFASPKALMEAWSGLTARLSSGELKSAFPKDATPEKIAEWRKENGIPEKSDEYDLKLDDGLVIGEEDKPLVGEFLKHMHATNATPATVKSALTAYYKIVEDRQVQMQEEDADYRRDSEDVLREEWGGDFKRNINMVGSLLDSAPEGVKDRVLGGRTADGKRLGDDPAVLRWLSGLALEINPAETVVPGSGAKAASAIEDEIASINKMMGDKNSDYWKGPMVQGSHETKLQARYRELVEAQERLRAKNAA